MSTNDIGLLDTVRIGKGKVLWTVMSFGRFGVGADDDPDPRVVRGAPYAVLRRLPDGFTNVSSTFDRLTVVTKAGAA